MNVLLLTFKWRQHEEEQRQPEGVERGFLLTVYNEMRTSALQP